ncbi:MAG: sulfite exporter TauE/SafE family protein [Bacteroidota bacterium]
MQGAFISGLIIGFVGSLHCAGMCGPIAMVVHNHGNFGRSLIYNSGRILSYSLLGVVFGLLGEGLSLFGAQRSLTIAMGIMVMGLTIYPRFQARLINTPWNRIVIAPLRKNLNSLLTSKNGLGHGVIGLLNGLLPCGLVYLAVASGLALVDVGQALVLMVGFGLGTVPMMFGVGWGSLQIKKRLSSVVKFAVPSFAILVGILLVIRGLALDIPYLSPVMSFVGLGHGVVVCE